MPARHLTATEIAAFIDRTISDDARQRAETHLAVCAGCREELAACSQLAATAPAAATSPARRWQWAGLAVAAGLVGVAVTLARPSTNRGVDQNLERGATKAESVFTLAPAQGTTIRAGFRFVWHRVGGEATYSVVVTEPDGSGVWRADVADTSSPGPTNTLKAGHRYYWRVDALLRDGHVLQSATHNFTISQ